MQAMAKITTSVAVRQRQADGTQRERQQRPARRAAIEERHVILRIALYSNRWMRSPNRPRGRTSSTSTISRYIEASPADGSK